MVGLLIGLIIIYILFQTLFKMTSHGHIVEYKIKHDEEKFEVTEVLTYKEKQEENNYYFEVKNKDNVFTFQIFEDMKKRNYVIKDIYSYEDSEYTCIYPIFKTEKQLTDILCMKDGIIYPYQSIKGQSEGVDQFKDNLNDMYSEEKYEEDTSNSLKKENLTIYRNNLLPKHYLSLENYKGIYLVNTKDIYKKIELFTNDSYKKEVAAFYLDKYITADYNQKYSFNEFSIVDIKSGKQEKIVSNTALNLDAYVMGTIDEKVYIYDKSNKEQYAINLKNNSISKIGNVSSGIQVYENGTWMDYSSYDAYNEKKTFREYQISDSKYDAYQRVDKVGNEKSGYYYFYKKNNNTYDVYRASVQNDEVLTYLFQTTDIQNIIYQDHYIYYINGTDICYYHDDLYIRKVVTNTELEYNKSLKFGLYIS
jgi:hypothetical protein